MLLNLAAAVSYMFYIAYYWEFREETRSLFKQLSQVTDAIFVLDLILNLLMVDGSQKRSKYNHDLLKIVKRNYEERFWIDLLSAVPLCELLNPWVSPTVSRLLYLLKVMRLEKAFQVLDTKSFQK